MRNTLKKWNLLGTCLLIVAVFIPLGNEAGAQAPPSSSATASSSSGFMSLLVPPTFQILWFGIDPSTGNPYMKVAGTAGAIKPPAGSTQIYGYVFMTDTGTWAVVSHNGVDSSAQTGPSDERYHSHRVTLDANNCITKLEDLGHAVLSGNQVSVSGTGAMAIGKVLTVILDHTAKGICVTQVLDSKAPDTCLGFKL
jgi:hypothetical protein